MNSVLQISCVTLEERFSIHCKGLSFNQFVFSLWAQNKKQLSIFILTFRPSILVSLPFGSYFTTHDTYGIFLPRPAPVANYSRKVCFINLWYVWCLMVFIIGIRHFFYCFNFGFRIPSQLKRVQPHLWRNPAKWLKKMAQGWCQIVDVANLCDGFLDVD